MGPFTKLGCALCREGERLGAVVALTEPTDLQKSLVDEVLFLRGRIVASYSQIEFLLANISVKLDLRFPYLIKDRIKAVRSGLLRGRVMRTTKKT
jgi:hypothetical protein